MSYHSNHVKNEEPQKNWNPNSSKGLQGNCYDDYDNDVNNIFRYKLCMQYIIINAIKSNLNKNTEFKEMKSEIQSSNTWPTAYQNSYTPTRNRITSTVLSWV